MTGFLKNSRWSFKYLKQKSTLKNGNLQPMESQLQVKKSSQKKHLDLRRLNQSLTQVF
jgi:hypothetical protein